MSPNRVRLFAAVFLACLFTFAAVVAVRSGASTLRAVLTMGGLLLLAIGFYDVIVVRSYGRRLRWIGDVIDELWSIAKREEGRLSSSPISDLDPLREKLSEVADAILRQTTDLERQRQVLGEIVNGMGEGLLAIDESKRIVLANDRIAELFGGNRPTTGRQFYEVLRHASLVTAFDHGLAGEAFRERATVTGAGGQERQVEIRVVPLGAHSGIAAIALVIDVTQIEMLARMRRDFIADFSHEVRTPLAGLRSSIETLHEGSLQHEQEEQLHRILDRQLGRLERLVADLAELNSIESGETVLHREPTPMIRLLRDLSLDFSERAGSRDIVINVDGAESVAWVDPIRIEQVFSNLIDNAIKHAPASNEVRIEVRDEQATSEVRVSDRGPGIPREERDKVFHRFYRMDKSRSSQSAGTGLGLAITKHLVLQHGGSIGVESEPGTGTTIVVRLPKHDVV